MSPHWTNTALECPHVATWVHRWWTCVVMTCSVWHVYIYAPSSNTTQAISRILKHLCLEHRKDSLISASLCKEIASLTGCCTKHCRLWRPRECVWPMAPTRCRQPRGVNSIAYVSFTSEEGVGRRRNSLCGLSRFSHLLPQFKNMKSRLTGNPELPQGESGWSVGLVTCLWCIPACWPVTSNASQWPRLAISGGWQYINGWTEPGPHAFLPTPVCVLRLVLLPSVSVSPFPMTDYLDSFSILVSKGHGEDKPETCVHMHAGQQSLVNTACHDRH